MLDSTQILILIMIVVLGGTLTLVGIQFYLILRELKKGMEKVNGILDEVHQSAMNITTGSQHIKESLQEVKEMATNIKEGLATPVVSGVASFGLIRSLFAHFFKNKNKVNEEEEYDEE